MALGARRASVVWMVLRETLVLVTLGLALGLPLAFAAARTPATARKARSNARISGSTPAVYR